MLAVAYAAAAAGEEEEEEERTMEEGRKRVVVVGGGVAGSLTSKLLENAADVTLVDPYSLSFSVHPYVLVIAILCLF